MVKNGTKEKLLENGFRSLLEKGKNRGFVTYEEMNDELPDEGFSPERLDNLLMTMDDMGIDDFRRKNGVRIAIAQPSQSVKMRTNELDIEYTT